VGGIAGIYSPRRNVFGLMPHPERMADPALGGALGGADGKKLFAILLAKAA
jgi:phosphoribosylformylglycinamidine synthase